MFCARKKALLARGTSGADPCRAVFYRSRALTTSTMPPDDFKGVLVLRFTARDDSAQGGSRCRFTTFAFFGDFLYV